MWPLLARLAASGLARAAAGTATRSAVTSAAESGAIRAGTTSATSGSGGRVLSAMQFGSSAAQAMPQRDTGSASSPAPGGDSLGWARS